MRFLVDANMPWSTLALLANLGHQGEHARDIGLGHAPDAEIAAHARKVDAARRPPLVATEKSLPPAVARTTNSLPLPRRGS